jgi:hypothetical protein
VNDKPFDNPFGEITLIKNVIIDHIMPTLSSDGWKVLCVALRRTWAGSGPIAYAEREGKTRIDYDQFLVGTGIQDQGAVTQALDECLAAGYLVRQPDEQDDVSGQPRRLYTLNAAFEVGGAETAPLGLETGRVQETETLVLPSAEHERAFRALMDYAAEMEADAASELVQAAVMDNDADTVLAWIETGREMTHLAQPERFRTVVQRLLDRVPPLPMMAMAPDPQPGAAQDHEDLAPSESAPVALAADELWQATLEQLASQMRKSKLKWLQPTQGVGLVAGTLTVAVPNKRTKEWLEEGQVATIVQQALESVAGASIELAFVVGQ